MWLLTLKQLKLCDESIKLKVMTTRINKSPFWQRSWYTHLASMRNHILSLAIVPICWANQGTFQAMPACCGLLAQLVQAEVITFLRNMMKQQHPQGRNDPTTRWHPCAQFWFAQFGARMDNSLVQIHSNTSKGFWNWNYFVPWVLEELTQTGPVWCYSLDGLGVRLQWLENWCCFSLVVLDSNSSTARLLNQWGQVAVGHCLQGAWTMLILWKGVMIARW